jgi:hypothetical protein
MNFLIYGAHFTANEKGVCKQAGVGFRCRFEFDGETIQKDYETISTTRTYGDLWLSRFSDMLITVERFTTPDADGKVPAPVEFIKLFTNQFEAGKMAKKIERILSDALAHNVTSLADIEHLVLKDGRYTPRPNNHLYAEIVLKLVQLHRAGARFEQHHLPSSHTMDLVKSLHQKIAPHKVLITKTKPKTKKPKAPPLIDNDYQ